MKTFFLLKSSFTLAGIVADLLILLMEKSPEQCLRYVEEEDGFYFAKKIKESRGNT
jgi:hypothetical protein